MANPATLRRQAAAINLDRPATFHERDLDTHGESTAYTDHPIWAKRVSADFSISTPISGAVDVEAAPKWLIRAREGAAVTNQDQLTVDGVRFTIRSIEPIGRRWMLVGAE